MKLHIKILSICLLLLSFIGVEAQVNLEDSLKAHYLLNGNGDDETGNNNGTVNGAVLTADRFGNTDFAYDFDGNDYVDIGDNADFQMGTNSFSMSAWFKADGTGGNGTIVSKRYWSGSIDPTYALTYVPSTQQLYAYWRFDDGTYTSWPIANGVTANTWHHAVFVFDRTSTVKLYVDGILAAQSSTLVGNPRTMNIAGGRFLIGKDDFFNQHFRGDVDEVHFYKKALTLDEINALYQDMEAIKDDEWDIPADVTVSGGVLTSTTASLKRVLMSQPVVFPWCKTDLGKSTTFSGKFYTDPGCTKGACQVNYGLRVGEDDYLFKVLKTSVTAYKNGTMVGLPVSTSVADYDNFRIALDSMDTLRIYQNNILVSNISLAVNSVGEGTFFTELKGTNTSLSVPLIREPCALQRRPWQYVELKDKLDGNYYQSYNSRVYFIHKEEYRDGTLFFKLYDEDMTPMMTEATPSLVLKNRDNTYQSGKKYGTNRYELYYAGAGLQVNKFYVLEVSNDKGEVKKLRFKTQ